jgi:hypothetical protein
VLGRSYSENETQQKAVKGDIRQGADSTFCASAIRSSKALSMTFSRRTTPQMRMVK